MNRNLLTALALSGLLSGCSPDESRDSTAPQAPKVAGRWYSAEQVERGSGLYQLHCAVCHATDGSATSEWRTPDANGVYPPPPLNGTAHTWHHPLELLDSTIANGGAEFGGAMPGFGAVLDASERLAIVAWFQNLWSDEIYANWKKISERS